MLEDDGYVQHLHCRDAFMEIIYILYVYMICTHIIHTL